MRIRRALISVWDKQGLLPFVRGLRRWGVAIISTGGTAKLLKSEGIPVKEVAEFTGFPEILAGRVKTLHPRVHAGILASRQDRRHLSQVKRLGLELIDLVVVNLYPFEETAQRPGASMGKLIERIDIGGAALMRSAAKNFSSVGIVCRPSQYEEVLKELDENRGALSQEARLRLAVDAFAECAYYDTVIHQVLAHRKSIAKSAEPKGVGLESGSFPDRLVLGASKRKALRYGENPHQVGIWYRWPLFTDGAKGLACAQQLHGKELSFNNLLDLDAALQVVSTFQRPCAAVIKHTNPCGVACGDRLKEAFEWAFATDPISAFGGIVGFNRPVDKATAQAIFKSGFLECILAPGYHAKALQILKAKKNLRILRVPSSEVKDPIRCVEFKQISGGLLVQEPDCFRIPPSRWRLCTKVRPTSSQIRDLEFAWKVARFVRSNAIVIAKSERTVGIGAGQASRVDSVRVALEKAGARARRAVLASDGFFPQPDGPKLAVKAGVRAMVQPGGSIKDPQVIHVAEKAKIPMLFTGERHFRH